MRLLAAFLAGSLFGLGIVISGMANPAKVVNFFDISGQWDPSLAFVMGSALMITFVGYRLIFARGKPLLDSRLELPTRTDLDKRLILGSATFGVGWGIAGFCPGAAIPTLSTGLHEVFIFTAALVTGILVAHWARALLDARKSAKPA